jgi:hypothetical protein
MAEGPEGPRAQALAARWFTLVSRDAEGNREIEAGIRNAWEHLGDWPLRLREHVASLYLLDLQPSSRFQASWKKPTGRWTGSGYGGAARPPNENESHWSDSVNPWDRC